jgi:hypothetical protein
MIYYYATVLSMIAARQQSPQRQHCRSETESVTVACSLSSICGRFTMLSAVHGAMRKGKGSMHCRQWGR